MSVTPKCGLRPQFSPERGLSDRAVIQAVLDGLEQGKKEFGVAYGVIVCAMRHLQEEENLAMLRTASEFLGKGVCAADLAGNEAGLSDERVYAAV